MNLNLQLNQMAFIYSVLKVYLHEFNDQKQNHYKGLFTYTILFTLLNKCDISIQYLLQPVRYNFRTLGKTWLKNYTMLYYLIIQLLFSTFINS